MIIPSECQEPSCANKPELVLAYYNPNVEWVFACERHWKWLGKQWNGASDPIYTTVEKVYEVFCCCSTRSECPHCELHGGSLHDHSWPCEEHL